MDIVEPITLGQVGVQLDCFTLKYDYGWGICWKAEPVYQ